MVCTIYCVHTIFKEWGPLSKVTSLGAYGLVPESKSQLRHVFSVRKPS